MSRPERFELGKGAELRRYTLEDAPELFALVNANRERLRRWLPWVDPTRTVDDERSWLASVIAVEDGMDGYGLFVDGRLAGSVGVTIGPFHDLVVYGLLAHEWPPRVDGRTVSAGADLNRTPPIPAPVQGRGNRAGR